MQVWEFRSKEVFTKGDAVEYLFNHLLEDLKTDRSRVLAIHIGDDKTDEDAFKVTPKKNHLSFCHLLKVLTIVVSPNQMLGEKGYGFGILVTTEPKPTRALYSLEDPSEVMHSISCLYMYKLVGC
jgi:trehalose 6-phosphate phosphatase